MGIFAKKPGGTAIGNALRGIKNIALPVVDMIDEAVTGGKLTDAIDLISGKGLFEDDPERTLKPIEVQSFTKLLIQDIQDARAKDLARVTSKEVPLFNKIAPVIMDLMIASTFCTAFFVVIHLMFYKESATKDTIIQAVLLFGSLQSVLMLIVTFYRGGNNHEQHGFIQKLVNKK